MFIWKRSSGEDFPFCRSSGCILQSAVVWSDTLQHEQHRRHRVEILLESLAVFLFGLVWFGLVCFSFVFLVMIQT